MDNSTEIRYNDLNDNDDVTSQFDKVVEKIDLSNLENVTVPDCEHKNTTRKSADDEFNAPIDEVHCLDCPVGWHIVRASS